MSDDYQGTDELLRRAVEHDPFSGPALVAVAPITEPQREVWLACQFEPEATLAYNEATEISLKGALDLVRLRECWSEIVERHEILRTSFSPDGEWLCVLAERPLHIPFEDLGGLSEEVRETRLVAIRREEVLRRFDLAEGALIAVRAVRLEADEHRVFFTAHHIVVDGWSAAEIYQDFARLYDLKSGQSQVPLPAAPSYCAFARDEARWRLSAEGHATEQYWLKQFQDAIPEFELPVDFPREATRSFAGGRVDRRLDPALVAALRRVGNANGASLVAITLAAFGALLQRLTGAEDLVVGLAAAAQSYLGKTGLVGHAVNLLPLRLRPAAELPFSQYLQHSRGVLLDGFDHQRFTFGTLLQKLKLARDPAKAPLVPVVFNIDVRNDPICPKGIELRYKTLEREYENFELFVNAVDDGNTLTFECSYNAGLFKQSSLEHWLNRFEALLVSITENPGLPLAKLAVMSAEERTRLLVGYNLTAAATPRMGLHECILTQASLRPWAVAVQAGDQRLTYAALVERSEAIADILHSAGVAIGSIVGVALPRSTELPAALLAIHRLGAAYLPLDPELPEERLAYLVEDAQAPVVLTVSSLRERLPKMAAQLICLDTAPRAPDAAPTITGRPELPAYLIYTSGSTGKPKGVLVPQSAVVNCLSSIARDPGLGSEDVQLAVTTLSFDIAACDFFMPLMVGARLVLAERETAMDGELLLRLLEDCGANFMQCTPSTWRLLLAAGWRGSTTLTGVSTGEPLPRDLATQLAPKLARLYNLYGPTETTIWSTGGPVSADQAITIGRPIANTRCYILDAQRELVPEGVAGELYIAGAGVALGYHRRAALTAEKFLPDRFYPGERMYRTGDLARWLPGGVLDCLGRIDYQVKLRGFRIELGEIEFGLNQHPAVAESVLLIKPRTPGVGDGDPRLIAYFAARPGGLATQSELRGHLKSRLPPYMLPQHFVELDALPRLPNGKLDRKQLPSPFAETQAIDTFSAPPQGAAELAVAAIWAEVLGHNEISRNANFLDLGGHSLLAVQAASKLSRHFGKRPVLRQVLMAPLSALALSLADAPVSAPAAAETPALVVASQEPPAAAAEIVVEKRAPKKPGFWAWLLGE